MPCPSQPDWLIRVKRSASVTGFVLAEGTHQTDVFSAYFDRYGPISMTTGGVPDATTCCAALLLTSQWTSDLSRQAMMYLLTRG